MTFIRYSIVCGGASKIHHYLALLYVILLLYGSWWEFFLLLPGFANMNSTKWLFVANIVCADINLASYVLYDVFYLVMLAKVICDNNKSSTAKSADNKLQILAFKAMGHIIFSLLGIIFYTKFFPIGIAVQNIFITAGIHFFLNWKSSHLICTKTAHSFSLRATSSNISKYMISSKVRIHDVHFVQGSDSATLDVLTRNHRRFWHHKSQLVQSTQNVQQILLRRSGGRRARSRLMEHSLRPWLLT